MTTDLVVTVKIELAKQLGFLLKLTRLALNLELEEAADLVGCSLVDLSMLEGGQGAEVTNWPVITDQLTSAYASELNVQRDD